MPTSKYSYQHDDVCIIGFGCVLPDAAFPAEYWQNLVNNHCSLAPVPASRWNSESHYCPSKTNKDKSYVQHGCFVDNAIINHCAEQLNESAEHHTRLNLMAKESVRQALTPLSAATINDSKIDIILGCMAADESIAHLALKQKCYSTIERLKQERPNGWQETIEAIELYFQTKLSEHIDPQDTILTTSVLKQIKDKYALKGEGFLIDAACASSLAALDNACNRLKAGECDFALSGGMEADLGASTFTLFSSVGALSNSRCKPFDKSADGLVQGEGAVVFLLQRLEDALSQQRKIYGVIKSCAGASDGRSSSLFSPSVPGQLLAYQRAYKAAGTTPPDYIECHGTGTTIGDGTELSSLSRFFKNSPITIGSSKSMIGHTKAAAGAAGLLKCVLAMQHRQIPPSEYFESFAQPYESIDVHTHLKPLPDQKHLLRMGVSSFGFGNINYHLVIDEFSVDTSIRIANKPKPEDDIVIVAQAQLPARDAQAIHDDITRKKIPIPPLGLPQTDSLQLNAVLATEHLLEIAGIHTSQLDPTTTSVIAASSLGLPKAWEFSARVGYDDLLNALDHCSAESKALVLEDKEALTPTTEDIGPGILNNIIAAKVTNTCNFNGTNYNIDGDGLSFPIALACARHELNQNSSLVIIIGSQDHFDSGGPNSVNADTSGKPTSIKGPSVKRGDLYAVALATRSTALEKALPIQAILKKGRYSE